MDYTGVNDQKLAKCVDGLVIARGLRGWVRLIGRWVGKGVGSADVGGGDDVED